MAGELSFACPVHIPIFSILQLAVSELCVTQSDHITFTWNGHCACAVSRDLCTGGPPKPHIPIFSPRIVYSLYNVYGATTTIKGSFILEHPHVEAVFGRKEVQSKSVPKMAVFRKFKGLRRKYTSSVAGQHISAAVAPAALECGSSEAEGTAVVMSQLMNL